MECIKAITATSEELMKNPKMSLTDLAKNATECHDQCAALLERAKVNNVPGDVIEQIEERSNLWRIASGIAIIAAVVMVGGGVSAAVWYFGTTSLSAETVSAGVAACG